MSDVKPRVRALANARIDLDDAATLLCKDRFAIDRLVRDGRLRTVPNSNGGLSVRLDDVVKIRQEGWQAIRDMALQFISALEDEMLEVLLDEWQQRKESVRPKKTWSPPERQRPKGNRRPEAG